METITEGKCQGCKQQRPLFTFSWVPDGWSEFTSVELCARCHSTATVKDEQSSLVYNAFGEVSS